MMGDWDGIAWSGMGFGVVFMLLFWMVVVLGIVALIRWLLTLQSPNQEGDKTPLELLQERYARGEIDRDEYQQKLQDLERRR